MRKFLPVCVLVLCAFAVPFAQSKPALTRADYGQWESLSTGQRGGFSPDGAWLAYSVSRSDRTAELRFVKLADGSVKSVVNGGAAAYTPDSHWAASSIGYNEAEQEQMRLDRKPIQNKLALLNLATGEMTTTEGIQTFAFSGDGRFLAMRRYAPQAEGAGAGAATPGTGRGGRGGGGAGAEATGDAETPAVGATLIIRELATGRDTTFGNVAEYAWQSGLTHLIALGIGAEGQVGNGLHLFNPESQVLRVLDSASAGYSDLAWRKDSADLVALKSKADSEHVAPTYVALAWRGLGTPSEHAFQFDPASHAGVAAGLRTVTFRRPAWTDDGRMVFLGVAAWKTKPPAPSRGESRRPAADADEPAAVDVWHWTDVSVMARQKLSLAQDRRRNLLAVWHVDDGTFVQLGKSDTEQVTPVPHSNLAYIEEWSAYAMERSIGRPAADLYVADLTSGQRTKLKDRVNDGYAQVSPGGKYVLYLDNDQYWTINLATRAVANLSKAAPGAAFINRESDSTGPAKPPYGVGGWTANDAGLLLYDKLDIWQISPDGSKATRLTNSAADEVRSRLVRLNPDDDFVTREGSYVSLFGLWSKKSGYGRLASGAGAAPVERLLWQDASVTSLGKAKDADAFVYMAQRHDDSPDLFVGTAATLAHAKQVTTTNPFQDKFAWSRSEIVEYKTEKAGRLQGALHYPAGYQAGKTYPMIVYMYEKLSDNVHRYVAPSDRDYYNTTVFTSQGYFVLQPDIVFRPREPGLSVTECVTAAVQAVLKTGMVDAAKVGAIGHSWGGFDAAFLATHTNGVFAAAVAGAPITDLVSNYGNHHWSSGIAETDHIETGQQRMEVPLYEDLQAYVRNSAVFNAQNMTVPLLIEVGDADGTVFWHQGVELYNIARRAKKNVVMLVYAGEDHGLRQKKDQVDYQHRILQWFGHYLKGDTAEAWITTGVPAISR